MHPNPYGFHGKRRPEQPGVGGGAQQGDGRAAVGQDKDLRLPHP